MTAALLLLTGCPGLDMQGNDPREYYAEHPIKNSIESRSKTILVHFAAGQNRLSPAETDNLSDGLHPLSMAAVESIHIGYAPVDAKNEARRAHLKKMLRNMGYAKGSYAFSPSTALTAGEMQLDISYSIVISPDCPDWRTSPVTTHSNTHQGNYGCASEVNLGMMVADPHDLVRGTEEAMPIDTITAAKSVQDYHEGKSASGGSTTSASGGSSSTGANSSGDSSGGGAAATQ